MPLPHQNAAPGLRPATPLAVAALATLLWAAPATGAVALRQQLDLRGDFRLIGNTLAQDRAAGVPAPVVGTLCTTGGSGTCGANTSDSGADAYWRADLAAGTAACSRDVSAAQAQSAAVLQLPAGATVRYARLYWAGYVTSDAYDPSATLTTPDGEPHPLAADAGWTASTANAGDATGRWWYQASADVTGLVSGGGRFLVGDVDSMALAGLSSEVALAGWWLVVFYEDPAEITLRNLTLFDGFEWVWRSTAQATLSGFRVPPGGFDAKLGVVAWEGDAGLTGDRLQFMGYTTPGAAPTTLVDLADGQSPAANFFNRTRSWLGAAVTVPGDLPQLSGAAGSMGSFDLDVVDLKANGAIAAGNDAAVIAATSSGDAYVLGGFVTSISTLRPDFLDTVKSARNVDRVEGTLAGDRLEYAIEVRNGGNDPSVGTVLTDALPAGLTPVPGSVRVDAGPNAGPKTDAPGDDQADWDAATRTLTVRLGAGATSAAGGSLGVGESTRVVFQATVDAGAAGTLDNQAAVVAAGLSGQPATTFPSRPPAGGGATRVVIDECLSDAQCGGATPACLATASPRICVGCLSDAHCGGATPVCDLAALRCVGPASLAPAAQEKPAVPGTAVPFALSLRSQRTAPERFDLDVLDGGCAAAVALEDGAGGTLGLRDAAGAWTTAAGADADGDGRPDVAAAAGQPAALVVRLTQAAGAPHGEACLARVEAVGQLSGPADPAEVAVRAAFAVTYGPDRLGAQAPVAPAGGTVRLAGVIQNNGAAEASFALAALVAAEPAAGALAGATFFSDPDGDGDPSDGAPFVETGPVAPFGGQVRVVLEVRASTAAGAPLAAGSRLDVTATAASGPASAQQRSEAWVGWIVPAPTPGVAASGQAFAPCDTVLVRAQRLPAADGYALEWYGVAEPRRGVDAPVRTVDPWPVSGGAADDALALPADAPGAVTVVLLRRQGGLETVLDVLPLTVDRSGLTPSLDAPARVVMGQPLPLSAGLRSEALVSHRAARLLWAVTGAGQALDASGAFVAAPAVARQRTGLDLAPAGSVVDAFEAAPAWPAAGRYQVEATWQPACGAAPALAAAAAEVEVAPPPPVIAAPAPAALLATATPAVAGQALPGATVQVTVDGVALPPVQADAAGAFAVQVPAGGPLPDGLHVVLASQAQNGVDSGAGEPLAFTVDTTPPALAVAWPAPGALLGGTAAPGGAVQVTGTAEAGAAVAVSAGGQAAAVVRQGAAFTALLVLADGRHELTVSAVDPAGNPALARLPVEVDVTPPAAPAFTSPIPGGLVGGPALVGGLVPVQGAAEDGAAVRLQAGDLTLDLAAAGGSFAAALPLADGPWTLQAVATDAAGNASPPGLLDFTLDATPPAQAVLETPAPGQLLGAAQAPQGVVAVLGGAEPGAAVAVTIDGQPIPAVASGGLFGLGVALADGLHLLEVVVADAAGNRAAPLLLDFTVDTTPPPAPVLSWPGTADRPAPGEVALRGTAEPGARVRLSVAGAALETTAAGDGTWTAPATLAAGTFPVTLAATDAAGNQSPAGEATVVVAATAGGGGGGGGGGGTPASESGCGCGHGAGGAPSAVLLLGLLALWPRVRRSRARRP